MSKVLEKVSVNRICPHCKEYVSQAWVCKMEADGIIRYIYFCPNCQKPLHISSRKDNSTTFASKTKNLQV